MGTNRVEAFSDGVIAVIITIMVLELKVPAVVTAATWALLLPSFLVYALSFLVVAIMWVNHHQLLHTAKRADARLLWANNNLLFWMSLIPFVTAYLGGHYRAPVAVACYGAVLTLTSVAFLLLQGALAQHQATDSPERAAFRRLQRKTVYSIAMYAFSILLAFVSVRFSLAIFVIIPLLYFLPDRAIAGSAKTV